MTHDGWLADFLTSASGTTKTNLNAPFGWSPYGPPRTLVIGGPEVIVAKDVRGITQSTSSSKIVFIEVQKASYRYVGIGEQGLYAIALP